MATEFSGKRKGQFPKLGLKNPEFYIAIKKDGVIKEFFESFKDRSTVAIRVGKAKCEVIIRSNIDFKKYSLYQPKVTPLIFWREDEPWPLKICRPLVHFIKYE